MLDSNSRVLILGSYGLLGSHLSSGPYFQECTRILHGRDVESNFRVDLLDTSKVYKMLEETRPNVILNLVGVTDVDRCEQFPDEAYRGNVRTVESLVTAMSRLSYEPFLVHISTDQVYDGPELCAEGSVTLRNYYAFSKYAAELIAKRTRCAVLRTNFFGKSRTGLRNSLSDWVFQALTNREKIKVVQDIFFNPLSLGSVCSLIERVAEKQPQGIYNLGARDGMSKADFAFQFAQALALPVSEMKRARASEVTGLRAARPKDMRMNVSKFERFFGEKLPSLPNEIKLAAMEYLQ